MSTLIRATGRRKTSKARVTVIPGSGKITVNNKTVDEYFGGLIRQKKDLMRPLDKFTSFNKYDYDIAVVGGGVSGQAGAIRHGLARALVIVEPEIRGVLKKEGFLTRDPRAVERKKPGFRKARRRFQYSKR